MSTASIIESGDGWSHVLTISSNVAPNVLYLTPMKNLVDGGKLPLMASSQAQKLFFKTNNVTRLNDPILFADSAGYNTENALQGTLYLHFDD